MNAPENATNDSEEVEKPARRLKLSLFWRTFFLLGLLILCSSLAWLQMFRTQEYEPRILRNAHQIATVVNLTKTALIHTDAIARVSLLKMLADEESFSIQTREPGDRIIPFGASGMENRLVEEMVKRLGPGTLIASSVNDTYGLWVGFKIERDSYWLQMDPERLQPLGGSAWLTWLGVTLALSLAGAAMMAGLINRPLKRLSFAASQVREGHFNTSTLDEDAATSEIREVNIGFNRMAERLAKIEQERALMLAGISHDLRTPLARLRLETELSVADLETRDLMAADIAQLDGIIDKFLDYARPEPTHLEPVLLSGVISRSIAPWRHNPRFEIKVDVAEDLQVKAEQVELVRVLSNLLENARRYGQSPSDGITRVEIVARVHDGWVLLRVRDQGPGIPDYARERLFERFYSLPRGEAQDKGSGLGLCLVKEVSDLHGGQVWVENVAQPTGCLARWRPRMPVAPRSDDAERWVALPGMPDLVRHWLVAGPRLRTVWPFQVTELSRHGRQWALKTNEATHPESFDDVVLAMPPEQAAVVLAPHRPDWARQAAATPMWPCWTLMALTDAVDWPFDAARPSALQPQHPLGWLARAVEVHTRGGALRIEWPDDNAPVLMTGPAEFVFDGEIDL